MTHALWPLRLLPVLLLAACAARRANSEGAPQTDFGVLTSAELDKFHDAYTAVRTLRPAWLRTRAAGSFQGQGQVLVYRDGMQFGGVDRLSSINTVEIESLRYYDGIAATQRWGLGHENGVIYVTSKLK